MGSGSSVYTDFIKEQLTAEETAKAALEAKGLAVITTSGTLVTLLFGLAAVITGVQGYTLPEEPRDRLTIALILIVVAALAALVTNLPQIYKSVDPESLDSLITSNWADPQPDAERFTSETRVDILRRAQAINSIKAGILLLAMTLEILGVGFIAAAIRSILTTPR